MLRHRFVSHVVLSFNRYSLDVSIRYIENLFIQGCNDLVFNAELYNMWLLCHLHVWFRDMKLILRFIPLVILLGAIGAAYAFDLHTYLSLEGIQAQKEQFKAYIDAHPLLAPLIFIGIYTACVALSLPIATLLTLLGGFLFGLVQGTLFVVLGATIGATIVFVVAQTSLGNTLRERAGKFYKKIESNMKDNAVGYLLFMRLVPIFPFVAVNVAPALFNVPLRVFVLTTFFGIMPGSAAYVYFGQQLGEIDKLGDLASPQVILAFVLLGVFALIPTLYKQFKNRKKKDVSA